MADIDAQKLYQEAQAGHGCTVLDAFNGMTLDQTLQTYSQFNKLAQQKNGGLYFPNRVDLDIDTVKIPTYRWSDHQSITLRAYVATGPESSSTQLFKKYLDITDGTVHTECKPDALKSPKETKTSDKKL
jgi:hypothetical protein